MPKIFYRKLVRDRIPEIIKEKGSECETHVLSEEEFKAALRKKVGEEASALPECSRAELISEIADIHAVLEALQEAEGITDEELTEALDANEDRKGGFDKRLFLEWSSDDGYRTNETTN